MPINRLYFLINLLIKIDDVKFIPQKELKKEKEKTCEGYKFKVKPYQHQIEGINYGLNHDGWLLLDEAGLGKSSQII